MPNSRGARLARLGLLALAPLALVASIVTPAEGAKTAVKYATVNLTVSYANYVPDDMPLVIAINKGIFKSEGLNVTAVALSGSATIDALISGQAQFDMGGASNAIQAAAAGSSVRYIGNLDEYGPHVFIAKNNITSASQLDGQTFASTSAGGTSTTCLLMTFARLGVTGYKIDYVGTPAAVNAALSNGTAVGACTSPPGSYPLEGLGYHIMYNLTQKKIGYGNMGITTTASEIASNPGVVQRFVTSIAKAVKYEKTPSKKAAALSIWEPLIGSYSKGVWNATYDYYVFHVVGSSIVPTSNEISLAKQYLIASDPAAANVNLNTFIDAKFAKAANTLVNG